MGQKYKPREGQHPHILANAEASDSLTFRAIVSSGYMFDQEKDQNHEDG
jgi:hypothetical protein